MSGELVSILILFLVILYQGWTLYDQRKSYNAEISALIDRIMSKDYPMYIQGEVAKEQAKATPEPYEERGIPI